ncbi:HD domain-containing protein [Streptomyces albireticuli]|uniref:HD domain-containing protein n=2 Tax=Streptomyces albireticuli TaxID=1940 RepID=UPI001E3F24F4|nr:HD domain-containing protein [Streptomyces albireticuli]MCD9142485.1 metal-dependent phosphohydrolase [Streptomyces albireticuli]MCD9163885.1 metal-dependent phosphohydrolase [Streptomyces albireticuli]MCD9192613.1 metal-dependent phosphohydrolase [Streptomyces albireticuli]
MTAAPYPGAPPGPRGHAERRPGARPGARTARRLRAAAAALALTGLGWTAWHGLAQPRVALAFGVLIALGEAARRRHPATVEARDTAPVGAAGGLAYALLGEVAGAPAAPGPAQVVAVVLAATLTGALGRPPARDHLARRLLTTGFAATCFQPLHHSGALDRWIGHGPYYAPFLLLLLALTALCDAVLAAALGRARTGGPYGPALRDELRALPGIGGAVCATGTVMALAVAVAGLWALPVFCLPLLLAQLSFRRWSAVRATCHQTIASLARSTEIAGHTRPGHARRVAALSRATGRELGLRAPDLTVLEYAALMHDIGQLSLVDPVPAGATEPLPPAERRRIALLGGAVVRQTGVPAEVAVVVERQADPYREQPLAARIVRTVNAFEDLTGDRAVGPLLALERLRLATAHEHDPQVVEALGRVLARGPDSWGPARGPARKSPGKTGVGG